MPFLSVEESELVKLKALEQALRLAALAHADPDPLIPAHEPVVEGWPFRLTQNEVLFLRTCPFPISPA